MRADSRSSAWSRTRNDAMRSFFCKWCCTAGGRRASPGGASASTPRAQGPAPGSLSPDRASGDIPGRTSPGRELGGTGTAVEDDRGEVQRLGRKLVAQVGECRLCSLPSAPPGSPFCTSAYAASNSPSSQCREKRGSSGRPRSLRRSGASRRACGRADPGSSSAQARSRQGHDAAEGLRCPGRVGPLLQQPRTYCAAPRLTARRHAADEPRRIVVPPAR